MARLEFPWMSLTLSPSSAVSFPDELVLSVRLEHGRVMVQSGRREILKLVTPEAELRGSRPRHRAPRRRTRTLVSCVDGRFVLQRRAGRGSSPRAQGALVRAGQEPQGPFDLPAAPSGLVPGPIRCSCRRASRWPCAGRPGHGLFGRAPARGGDTVLVQRDASAAALELPVAWPGAFRWRVAARDERGLEGLPSGDGQIVVE